MKGGYVLSRIIKFGDRELGAINWMSTMFNKVILRMLQIFCLLVAMNQYDQSYAQTSNTWVFSASHLEAVNRAVFVAGDQGDAAGEAILRDYRMSIPETDRVSLADIDAYRAYFLARQQRYSEATTLARQSLTSAPESKTAGAALAHFALAAAGLFVNGYSSDSSMAAIKAYQELASTVGAAHSGGPAAILSEMDIQTADFMANRNPSGAESLATEAVNNLMANPYSSHERQARGYYVLAGIQRLRFYRRESLGNYRRALLLMRDDSPERPNIVHLLTIALIGEDRCDVAAPTLREEYSRLRNPLELTDNRIAGMLEFGHMLLACRFDINAAEVFAQAAREADLGLAVNHPLRVNARISLAASLLKQNANTTAAKLVEQAIAMAKTSSIDEDLRNQFLREIDSVRAELLWRKGNFGEASHLFRDIIAASEKIEKNRVASDKLESWAVMLAAAGRPKGALDAARLAIRRKPVNAVADSSLAGFFLTQAWKIHETKRPTQ